LRTENIIKMLKENDYSIVIVGEKNHRETRVLSDIAKENLLRVISNTDELRDLEKMFFLKLHLYHSQQFQKRLL